MVDCEGLMNGESVGRSTYHMSLLLECSGLVFPSFCSRPTPKNERKIKVWCGVARQSPAAADRVKSHRPRPRFRSPTRELTRPGDVPK